jgi:hypothetical protein
MNADEAAMESRLRRMQWLATGLLAPGVALGKGPSELPSR